METNEFIKQNYAIAMKIHQISEKNGLSVDEARVLTYIHCKLDEHKGDFSYFDHEDRIAIDALHFLLNKKPIEKPNNGKKDTILDIPENLNTLDLNLREQFGMEMRIQSELYNRLKLHTNNLYRIKMVSLYKNKILPFLSDCSKVA